MLLVPGNFLNRQLHITIRDIILEAKSPKFDDWKCSCLLSGLHMHAHKIVLLSSCEYMLALFLSGMQERDVDSKALGFMFMLVEIPVSQGSRIFWCGDVNSKPFLSTKIAYTVGRKPGSLKAITTEATPLVTAPLLVMRN